MTIAKKHKVLKKVKEHHKKKAKEARKLGLNNNNRKPTKVDKNDDTGMPPNEWPLKEEELKAVEARRQRAALELESKKTAQKERLVYIT